MKGCPICESSNSRFERTLKNMTLVKCQVCSFVYLDLPDEEIEKANSSFSSDRSMETYEMIQTGVDKLWHEHIVKLFTKKIKGGRRVLDIGCGNGLLLKKFKEYGWECYGVDLSSWSYEFSKRYNFKFYHGRVEDSNFERDSFDLVINLSTFEHITRPVDFIESLAPFLKKGGYCYMAGIPNYGSFAIRLGISAFHHNRPPKHCNYFTPKSIRALGKRLKNKKLMIDSKTYGIPELHRFYNWITSVVRKIKKQNVKSTKLKVTPIWCYLFQK